MNMNRLKRNSATLLAIILVSTPLAAHAEEREDLEKLRATVLSLIDALVKNHVLPKEKADAMMREAETKANARLAEEPPPELGPDGKKIVRVPYIPDQVKIQMRDQIKSDVLAETIGDSKTANWLSRVSMEGDVRLRAEFTRLNGGNTPAADLALADANLTRAADIWGNTSNGIHNFNTQENASRTRVRARVGINARISGDVSGGVQMSTGGTTSPTSTNQTMGQGFNKYSVVFDRAFLKYSPEVSPGLKLNMSGGRFRNPFFGTDLVWSDDLNFEGFAMTLNPHLDPSTSAFITAGWFPVTVGAPNQSRERSLIALQGGMKWLFGTRDNNARLGLALYDYKGVAGEKQTLNTLQTAPDYLSSEYSSSYRQHGNTLFRINAPSSLDPATNWGLASDFRELNLTGSVDFDQFDPVHVVFTGDLVKNLSFNRNKIAERTGMAIADGKSIGYQGKVMVGSIDRENLMLNNGEWVLENGEWNVSLAYRYLGSDAVLDAFTNSDFGLGGTNSKGTILGFEYGIDKDTWLSAKWMSSNLIDSLVPATLSASHNSNFSVDLFQIDLKSKF